MRWGIFFEPQSWFSFLGSGRTPPPSALRVVKSPGPRGLSLFEAAQHSKTTSVHCHPVPERRFMVMKMSRAKICFFSLPNMLSFRFKQNEKILRLRFFFYDVICKWRQSSFLKFCIRLYGEQKIRRILKKS